MASSLSGSPTDQLGRGYVQLLQDNPPHLRGYGFAGLETESHGCCPIDFDQDANSADPERLRHAERDGTTLQPTTTPPS
jgi:hypothetical protein